MMLGWWILCVNLTGMWDAQINIPSGYVCGGVSRGEHWWPQESRPPSAVWVGTIQFIEGQRMEERRACSLLAYLHELRHWSSVLLEFMHWLLWFSGLWTQNELHHHPS